MLRMITPIVAWLAFASPLPGQARLPGELPFRLGREIVTPDEVPTIRQIMAAVREPEPRPIAMFRLYGDEHNHYAPRWSSDGKKVSFLRADLDARTCKVLLLKRQEAKPYVFYGDDLSYEHMNSFSDTGGLLAFSSNNEDSLQENIHLTDLRSSPQRVTVGFGAKILPSVHNAAGQIALLYRREDEVFQVTFPAANWKKRQETSLGKAEEAVWSPDGRAIAIVRAHPDGSDQLRLLVRDRSTGRETRVFSEASRLIRNPTWSPDGRHVAFYSRPRSQRHWELWVGPRSGNPPPTVKAPAVRVQEDFRHVGPAWGSRSQRLWYIDHQGDQGYYPVRWISVTDRDHGQVDYTRQITTAMDLTACPNPEHPALAVTAVARTAVDVYVVILNHP